MGITAVSGSSCLICHEFIKKNEARELRCSHLFHATCFSNWEKVEHDCPMCRKVVYEEFSDDRIRGVFERAVHEPVDCRTAFFNLIEKGELDKIKDFLTLTDSIELKDRGIALRIAVERKNIEIVRFLLECDIPSDQSGLALQVAVDTKQIEMIRQIVSKGKPLGLYVRQGMRAAVLTNNIPMLEVFLRESPSHDDYFSSLPMFYRLAIQKDYIDIVALFLREYRFAIHEVKKVLNLSVQLDKGKILERFYVGARDYSESLKDTLIKEAIRLNSRRCLEVLFLRCTIKEKSKYVGLAKKRKETEQFINFLKRLKTKLTESKKTD
jgi:hypothetical protein